MLTVRRNFLRPPEALVARFRDAPTGWVVDANGRRGALDHRIRAREHQPRVPILEPHQVRRLSRAATNLDNLASPARVPDVMPVNVKPISYHCFHRPASLALTARITHIA